MANCHISLSLFLSFKQRKSRAQLWKYLPHTLGKLCSYFKGNNPSRGQMRQHDRLVHGRLQALSEWKENDSLVSFANEKIYWNPLMFWLLSSCICYLWQPNSLQSPKRAKDAITSTLNSKNHPHYTLVRAHWHLDNTALRLIHILLDHIRFHSNCCFPGRRGRQGDCLGHIGKQLWKVLGIFPELSQCQPTVSKKETAK